MSEAQKPDDQKPAGLEVAGKKFNSVEDLAKAYEEASKVIGRQGKEMGDLRKLAKVEPKQTSVQPIADTLFENPALSLEQLKSTIREEIFADIENQNRKRDFWDSYFQDKKELAPMRDLIINDAETRLADQFFGKQNRQEQFQLLDTVWGSFAKKPAGSEEPPVSYQDEPASKSRASENKTETKAAETPADLGSIHKKLFG